MSISIDPAGMRPPAWGRPRDAVPLSLPIGQWPALDRRLREASLSRPGFLEPDKPASRWSVPRQRIVRQTYGQWLRFLDQRDALDPELSPGHRATKPLLRGFYEELRERVSPTSQAMMIGALGRMLVVLAPEQDWSPINELYAYLKQRAKPCRNKLAHVVPATQLLDLGLELMTSCKDQVAGRRLTATRYRDGLLIAMLICCPVRLANLTSIRIGEQLLFDGQGYSLRFTAAEIKTGRPYQAGLPHQLTPRVEAWLLQYRPLLQSISPDADGKAIDALWLSRDGRPMRASVIREQIESRTRAAFGHEVWPHLFRDCAVTELVDCAPEEIGMAGDLLGHASLQTTTRHYIQAKGMTAHHRMQEKIKSRRSEP